jgi:hypothetical protein
MNRPSLGPLRFSCEPAGFRTCFSTYRRTFIPVGPVLVLCMQWLCLAQDGDQF